ncbi:MAG: hypothetical protein JRF33_15295 [Deltaproteobacteria bacterium]|nr:hypothetical protein [Deltaproteobacteria bacterium]
MKNMKMNGFLGLAVVFGFGLGGVSASELKPGELELSTERVVIFKDGHGLFVKKAKGKTDANGELWTEALPDAASLGSFWISDAREPVSQAVAGKVERLDNEVITNTCANPVEILSANIGRLAEVVTVDGKKHRGKIIAMLEPGQPGCSAFGAPAPIFAAHVMSSRLQPALGTLPGFCDGRPRAKHFVLRAEGGDLLLACDRIMNLLIDKMNLQCSWKQSRRKQVKQLTIRYAKKMSGKRHELDLFYFRPGIRWIPTYRVELGADGKAELVLQAEILNEAEDLDGPVDFVVGLPTFRFGDVVSPMVLEQVLRNSLAVAAPQLMNQLASNPMSNAQFHGRAGERHGQISDGGSTGSAAVMRAMVGREVQDLYTYSVPRLTLRKGERALVELMRTKVPYRHLYTWAPKSGRSSVVSTSYGVSPLQLEKNTVWHQVVLKNNSGRPWTTGPALLMEKGFAVGQDMLTFTPAGAEVELPVTAAVSLRGSHSEEEIRRVQGAKRVGSRVYTLVETRMTLKLRNAMNKPARLVIRASVPGKVLKAAGSVEVTRLPVPGQQHEAWLHAESQVRFDFTLPAQAKAEREIIFQRYLRE